MDEALAQIDKISIYKGLSPKDTITLRLLTEEVAGNPNLSARFGFFVPAVILNVAAGGAEGSPRPQAI